MRNIATVATTNEILEKYDLKAKKKFGQNFIIEPGVVAKIAENGTYPEATCIEIGPGIGALTEQLSLRSKKVICYEIDESLLPVLADSLSECENVEVILKDFLTLNLKEELKGIEGPIVLCSNLPYYITSDLLMKIFTSDAQIERVTVMMQKEVADHFFEGVGSKEYGALQVIGQSKYKVSRVMKVARTVFDPKPNVDSAVLRFDLNEADIKDREEFYKLVKACFKQRRKSILNNYKDYLQNKEKAVVYLKEANIDENRRAESLSLEEFIRLHEVNYEG